MKLMTLAVAVAATVACVHGAQAGTQHHHRHRYSHEARRHASGHVGWTWRESRAWRDDGRWQDDGEARYASERRPVGRARHYGRGYGARPRAWCGWEMRQLVGSDPGPVLQPGAQLGALGARRIRGGRRRRGVAAPRRPDRRPRERQLGDRVR